MRSLIYVPIIHTTTDMGSESEALKKEYIKKFGQQRWLRQVKLVEGFWEHVREKILSLKLDYKRVRIYQDGLPLSGREMEIAREVAQRGSQNYKIILELIERGARLEGTEDPALLLKEYSYIKEFSSARNEIEREVARRNYARASKTILSQRDEFISERIRETLRDGETGILLIGKMHEVDKRLPKDIRVIHLLR